MDYLPFVADRTDLSDATGLIAEFGLFAAIEAAERARRSREIGNHLHFCRWRQIERLILFLSVEGVAGTVH